MQGHVILTIFELSKKVVKSLLMAKLSLGGTKHTPRQYATWILCQPKFFFGFGDVIGK